MQAAATRLARYLGHDPRNRLPEIDVERRLDRILQALHSEAHPPDAEVRFSERDATVDEHLLDLLYRETIRGWTREIPPPSSTEMVTWLRSFERVHGLLTSAADEPLIPAWPAAGGVDLAAELAHDLRSPLTSIIFLAETLRGGQAGPLNDLQRRQLGIIYSAALSLVSTASDVIELERGGLRLMERRPSPFSIAELLESTCDILRPIVEERGVSLTSVCPQPDQRLGHPVALSRVLLNLSSNAVRYTDHGSVDLSARAVGLTRVEFKVRDTGQGMDAEAQSKLFEPLRHNPQSNRFGFSGSGLGLAISRRLVAAMGGELRYETALGVGTTFQFEIDLPPIGIG